MTREQYIRMVSRTRRIVQKLPGREKLLNLPTYLCALIYLITLAVFAFKRDLRVIPAAAVPACCFLVVTLMRPWIQRQRPYDRFGFQPVGKWEPGKGKSMPSRHTVSAVSIAVAVVYLVPTVPVILAMLCLSVVISALRVLTGCHYISDVLAAAAIALLLSAVGYLFI